MANIVVFNPKTDIHRTARCFEDLEIGNIFMYDYPGARYHYIKVERNVSSYDNVNNAICIEDGSCVFFDKEQNVKKFIGEIALNGIFIKDEELN